MATPHWLPYTFAVVMVGVSVYCIGRLVLAAPLGRRNHYDVNVAHVLMGFAMVGMLVPSWNLIPVGLWELTFGVLAVYFLAQSVRFIRAHGLAGTDDHHVHHVTHGLIHMLMSLTMLYMYWLGMPLTTSSTGSMAMMSGPPHGVGDPFLTFLLIVLLLVSAVVELNGIGRFAVAQHATLAVANGAGGVAPAAGEEPAGEERWLAPRLEVWCHIAMCLTMAYMLVLMV